MRKRTRAVLARSVSVVAVAFSHEVVRHQRCGPLVLRRAADHRGACSGSSRGAHSRLRRRGVRYRAHALRQGIEVVFQGVAIEPVARLDGRARPHRLALFARQSGTSLRLAPCMLCVVRASWRSALVARFARLEAPCLAQVWHGKLALMARKQSVLHQPPNPFIERTPSSVLRTLPVAAHVQR